MVMGGVLSYCGVFVVCVCFVDFDVILSHVGKCL